MTGLKFDNQISKTIPEIRNHLLLAETFHVRLRFNNVCMCILGKVDRIFVYLNLLCLLWNTWMA